MKTMYASIRWRDDHPDTAPSEVIIALTHDLGEDAEGDLDVFFYAGDYPASVVQSMYSESTSPEEWYIVDAEEVPDVDGLDDVPFDGTGTGGDGDA